jgi:hypothetical protein
LRQWIDRFERLRQDSPRRSATSLCRCVGLPYSTLRRWRQRLRGSAPIWRQPGPAKTSALPVADFRARAAQLHHGAKRTRGTISLSRDFRHCLSRRRLQAFVTRRRRRQLRRLRKAKHHVTWHQPNLAWAIDALHLRASPADPGVVVVLARDLASHYHFEPLVLSTESASANVAWLQRLASRHGAPLVLKRDNGAPFNADLFNDFLAASAILPLNSPVRRPAYNGAIEHGVGSFKRAVYAALDPNQPVPPIPRLLPLLQAVTHLHNARPRRSLGGLTPATAYHRHCSPTWSRPRRHEIFHWIRTHARASLSPTWDTAEPHAHATAWRRSVVAWLRCQQLITVSRKPQPSPHFQPQIRS